MAWLILVLAVPFLGFVAFLLLGSTSVGLTRRAWQRAVNARVMKALDVEASTSRVLDRQTDGSCGGGEAGATPGSVPRH